MSKHYILDGKTPLSCDLMNDNRRVAHDVKDGISVSTVFLSLDYQWGEGPPLIFETMIFGGEHNDWQNRCST